MPVYRWSSETGKLLAKDETLQDFLGGLLLESDPSLEPLAPGVRGLQPNHAAARRYFYQSLVRHDGTGRVLACPVHEYAGPSYLVDGEARQHSSRVGRRTLPLAPGGSLMIATPVMANQAVQAWEIVFSAYE